MPETKPRRGAPSKRDAITCGARAVFGREGYSRASIDAIAAEAGVSTRTIYNHFDDKAHLFHTVIVESATEVAEAQIVVIELMLGKITDLEADLVAFGRAWASPNEAFLGHFGLVRQINAEAGHIPEETLAAWQEAGPRRVQHVLAERIRQLGDDGLLRIDDPERAARHLLLLTATEANQRSYHGAFPLPAEEITRLATAGVRTFLHGYLPPVQGLVRAQAG
jgi:AcrR family transcriptional regulator